MSHDISHLAIIMDGNGRWANEKGKARHFGHKEGVKTAKQTVLSCIDLNIRELTLFSFSSENWQRPKTEIHFLFDLMGKFLTEELAFLNKHSIRLRVIGDRNRLSEALQNKIEKAENYSFANSKLVLNLAVSYGGRWDISQAVKKLLSDVCEKKIHVNEISENTLKPYLALGGSSDPDLFIRTGGEKRISNFLLWNLAYTELYFSDSLWPDFGRSELEKAIEEFKTRERRYGTYTEVA